MVLAVPALLLVLVGALVIDAVPAIVPLVTNPVGAGMSVVCTMTVLVAVVVDLRVVVSSEEPVAVAVAR